MFQEQSFQLVTWEGGVKEEKTLLKQVAFSDYRDSEAFEEDEDPAENYSANVLAEKRVK